MRLIALISILLLPLITSKVFAKDPELIPFTREGVITYKYPSSTLNREFRLDIMLPVNYDSKDTDTTYPVVFMVDGYLDFPMAATDFLKQMLSDKVPPFIFVGIDHFEDPDDEFRTQDFTSTEICIKDRCIGGGADNFNQFLNNEIKSFIFREFNSDESDQTFIGHSLGGLFALHVLFTQSDSFQRYIIASPNTWWNNEAIFEEEATYAESNFDMKKSIYMFVGGRRNIGRFGSIKCTGRYKKNVSYP